MLGSMMHLLSNEDALGLFRAVHRALAPGGRFVVELPHPGDLFDATLIDPEAQSESWEQVGATTGACCMRAHQPPAAADQRMAATARRSG